MIAHTDRVSLCSLVATAEALNHAGITDPHRLYQHIHPSEVGTPERHHSHQHHCWGGSMFSSGPVKIPVGTCPWRSFLIPFCLKRRRSWWLVASMTCEEGFYGFSNMKATSNLETELAMGREPAEMSRPTTTTSLQFMESQGVGVNIVMSVKTVLRVSLPNSWRPRLHFHVDVSCLDQLFPIAFAVTKLVAPWSWRA
ncbi:hypothetical protein BGW80DRAFT_227162 [Lactifluus volemus]|nr:hypothetical protein BGW80DRAFT_227162 [Lactifluus volemus]